MYFALNIHFFPEKERIPGNTLSLNHLENAHAALFITLNGNERQFEGVSTLKTTLFQDILGQKKAFYVEGNSTNQNTLIFMSSGEQCILLAGTLNGQRGKAELSLPSANQYGIHALGKQLARRAWAHLAVNRLLAGRIHCEEGVHRGSFPNRIATSSYIQGGLSKTPVLESRGHASEPKPVSRCHVRECPDREKTICWSQGRDWLQVCNLMTAIC